MSGKEVSLGNRLCELREQAGLTQEALARRMEVAQGMVSDYERNKTEPHFTYLQLFTKSLEVSLAVFDGVTVVRQRNPRYGKPVLRK